MTTTRNRRREFSRSLGTLDVVVVGAGTDDFEGFEGVLNGAVRGVLTIKLPDSPPAVTVSVETKATRNASWVPGAPSLTASASDSFSLEGLSGYAVRIKVHAAAPVTGLCAWVLEG